MTENIWKTGTIILGICVILIIGFQFWDAYNKNQNVRDWKDTICQRITSTPIWLDGDGSIISAGFKELYGVKDNKTISLISLNDLTEILIVNKTYFLYREGCSWCEKQILEFKTIGFWDNYVNSNLTINCTG